MDLTAGAHSNGEDAESEKRSTHQPSVPGLPSTRRGGTGMGRALGLCPVMAEIELTLRVILHGLIAGPDTALVDIRTTDAGWAADGFDLNTSQLRALR